MKLRKLGFTLIELMVVISIMGIVFVLGMASFNSFNRQRLTRKAGDDIKINLRMAASRAKNNEKDTTVCTDPDTDTLDGWYFRFDPLPLGIYGSCGGGKTFGTTNISIPADTGITITTSPAVNDILFYPPSHISGNQTNLPAGGITISINDVPEFKVDPSGNVSNL